MRAAHFRLRVPSSTSSSVRPRASARRSTSDRVVDSPPSDFARVAIGVSSRSARSSRFFGRRRLVVGSLTDALEWTWAYCRCITCAMHGDKVGVKRVDAVTRTPRVMDERLTFGREMAVAPEPEHVDDALCPERARRHDGVALRVDVPLPKPATGCPDVRHDGVPPHVVFELLPRAPRLIRLGCHAR